MKHLIICREYPPTPSGGIGTYVEHFSRLLAENGETVHVIGQLWKGAGRKVEEKCSGRLIIHRLPFEDCVAADRKPCPAIQSPEGIGLYQSSYPAQSFSWQAALLAERLIEQEGIDILEAQEYEAPLYYFQLRRALGLGPKRQPPCIVHLHSPTEFIARYDDWDEHHPRHATAKRLEDYTILSADALLCPSRYLARRIEAQYAFPDGTIRVIPYPLGDISVVERDMRTWEQGTICYMGRLERRKGILEWIDAAVAVANDDPTVSFDFLGANVLPTRYVNGEDIVAGRIPEDLNTRFHFHGHHPHALLPKFLAGARVAVVPSRWDNFPNTCMEAMGSGLPVIASREGGMVEMIEDGRTGWVASKSGSEGLAEALRCALETPAAQLADMGREAASAIRRICDNGTTVQRQLDFRSRVVLQGCPRSLHLPANLPGGTTPFSDSSGRRTARNNSHQGLAFVITCFNNGPFLDDCLNAIVCQSKKPATVVIVDDGSSDEQTSLVLDQAVRDGWCVIRKARGGTASAKNAGIERVLQSEVRPAAMAFLDAKDRLHPNFVAACEAVFLRHPEVGLVSCWALDLARGKMLWSRPCPGFPYQWVTNDAAPLSAVRTEAFLEVGSFRGDMEPGYDTWDLFDTVMVSGWVAVTFPEILGETYIEDSRPYLPDPYSVVGDTPDPSEYRR